MCGQMCENRFCRVYRSRMGAILLDDRLGDVLQLANGTHALLPDRVLRLRATLGYLPGGMGRHVRRLELEKESQR